MMKNRTSISPAGRTATANREVYEAPEVTVVALGTEDILTTSNKTTPFVPNTESYRPEGDF